MKKIMVNIEDVDFYNMSDLVEAVLEEESSYKKAMLWLKIIQQAGAKSLSEKGFSRIELKLEKEAGMAAVKFYFRHYAAEAEASEIIYMAKNALACMLDDGEIEICWIKDKASKL